MKHITEDIFNEAMNGLDPALVAEHISKREELGSNKTRPARTYRLRRAAIAAAAAAAIAAGAAGAVFIANRAPEPGVVSEGSAGEAVNNSGENVSADDSGESDPDLPGTSSAESGPEALPSPYVNGVFFPYIYVDNLFHDMDVIKMYVYGDLEIPGLSLPEAPAISVLSAKGGAVIPLAAGNGGEAPEESGNEKFYKKYEMWDMNPGFYRPPEYDAEPYSEYISTTLANKLKYFEYEEKYAVMLLFPTTLNASKDEITAITERQTGEPLELKRIVLTDKYLLREDGGYKSFDAWYGTLNKEQILALAEQRVWLDYICSEQGEKGYISENYEYVRGLCGYGVLDYDEFYEKHKQASRYYWFNQFVLNPDDPGESALKALNEWCEYHGDRIYASEDGLIHK